MRCARDNNFIELYICWTITVFAFIVFSRSVVEGQSDEILIIFDDEWIYLSKQITICWVLQGGRYFSDYRISIYIFALLSG